MSAIETRREKLYRAAISCGHSIDSEVVKLYCDPRKSGNALSQLADRLDAVPPEPVFTPAEMKMVALALTTAGLVANGGSPSSRAMEIMVTQRAEFHALTVKVAGMPSAKVQS